MRIALLLLAAAMPFAAHAQKKKGSTASKPELRHQRQLLAEADSAERAGNLVLAKERYAEALLLHNDTDVASKRALVLIQLGDTAGYCGDHQRYAHRENGIVLERWKELCVREDSVPFAMSGLPEGSFPGMANVARRWSRSDGRTSHKLYDPTDSLWAVVSTSDTDTAFILCEEMPSFPGGEGELFRYLGRNVKYPSGMCISGAVYIRFVVGADGHVRDPVVVRGIHRIVDEEALRVVRSMPPWTPGRHNGEPVPVQYVLPIRFMLK